MAIPWQDHLIPDDSVDLTGYVEDENRVQAKTNYMIPIGPSIWMVTNSSGGGSSSSGSSRRRSSSSSNGSGSGIEAIMGGGDEVGNSDDVECSSGRKKNGRRFFQSNDDSNESSHPTIIVGLQGAGGAWVWNPQVPYTEELGREIQARCGAVKHFVVPNKHYMNSTRASPVGTQRRPNQLKHERLLSEWSRVYPQAKIYAPPDYDILTEQEESDSLVIDFVLTEDPKREYVLDIDQTIFRGSHTEEVVFFHRPSQTVLFGDLIQPKNLSETSSAKGSTKLSSVSTVSSLWNTLLDNVVPSSLTTNSTTAQTKTSAAVAANKYHGQYHTPNSWQFSFWWGGEQELARNALDIVLNKWQPSQIVMASQTTVVDEYATDLLEQVFAWVPSSIDEDENFESDNNNRISKTLPGDKKLLGNFRRGLFSTGDDYDGDGQTEIYDPDEDYDGSGEMTTTRTRSESPPARAAVPGGETRPDME